MHELFHMPRKVTGEPGSGDRRGEPFLRGLRFTKSMPSAISMGGSRCVELAPSLQVPGERLEAGRAW